MIVHHTDDDSISNDSLQKNHVTQSTTNNDKNSSIIKNFISSFGTPYHTLSIDDIETLFSTDIQTGLSSIESHNRLLRDGPNVIKGSSSVHPFKLFLSNLINGMSIILFIAMVVSFSTKQWIEAVVIVIIIISNGFIGFFQEYKSEQALSALQKMSSPTSRVIRDGNIQEIPTSDIVVGDILSISMGDIVGADLRLFSVNNLTMDEALLTGESLPVEKIVDDLDNEFESVGDRINLGYMSTIVTQGNGRGIVIKTGMNTQIGSIAKILKESKRTKTSPLRKRLDILSYIIFIASIILAVIVMAVNQWEYDDKSYILYAITVGICLIPEGLPTVVTLTMSVGVNSMTRQNAIVRRINALEMFGAVTNICSDKTGTLTQAKMVSSRLWTPSHHCTISGQGFQIVGDIVDVQTQEIMTKYPKSLKRILYCASLCNTAEILSDEQRADVEIDIENTRESSSDDLNVIGDPTEIALQVLAHKANLGKPFLLENGHHIIKEFPFDSNMKRMSVIDSYKGHKVTGYMKGAPERILDCCTHYYKDDTFYPLDEEFIDQVNEINSELASQGLRVLGFSFRPEMSKESIHERQSVEKDFTFIGFIGIYDPPRPESRRAVEICHRAGITVHMVTGDHQNTARAIAQQINIIPEDYTDSMVMNAIDFDAMTDDEIDSLENLPLVVARCSPETKVKFVSSLHRRHKTVAMTGDGVNDSPALSSSDIGISMGKTGSDVAKQSSDIILTDDNFATIVSAVSTGRRILTNIVRILLHLFSGNVAQVSMLMLGLAVMDERNRSIFPLSPLQALWINLITSVPPCIGLGYEQQPKETMRIKPKSAQKRLVNFEFILDIFYYGLLLGCCSIASFIATIYISEDSNLGYRCNKLTAESMNCRTIFRARGVSFITLAISLVLHAYNCKHQRKSIFKTNFTKNNVLSFTSLSVIFVTILVVYIPYLNDRVFVMTYLTASNWLVAFVSILAFMLFCEIFKLVKRCFVPSKVTDMSIPLDEMELKAIYS